MKIRCLTPISLHFQCAGRGSTFCAKQAGSRALSGHNTAAFDSPTCNKNVQQQQQEFDASMGISSGIILANQPLVFIKNGCIQNLRRIQKTFTWVGSINWLSRRKC